MRVLGLGGSHHDFCAALVQDGQVVAAVEEERLTRLKIAFGLGPRLQHCLAATAVLDAGNCQIDDVDLVVANDFVNRVYTLRYRDRVRWMGHHLAHAASTFYTSPFETAAVLVVDGRGSSVETGGALRGETVTWYRGDAKGLDAVHQVLGRVTLTDDRSEDPYEDSIGWMYEAVSKAVGFIGPGGMGEPGKTMGLAPYGSPRYVKDVARLYTLEDGVFRQGTEQQIALRSMIAAELASAGDDATSRAEVRADFAFAVQENTERIMIEVARQLHQRTGERQLCLAGGVALNSVANYKLLEETPFEEIYVVSAAGDSGTAIGAALYGHHELAGFPWAPSSSPFSPYLGRAYSDADIEVALHREGSRVTVSRPPKLYDQVAQKLAAGAIVGWFQGRSESGPRALGNRSILADPRRADMKDHLNAKVKHREAFRPFAPVVLQDRQAEFFDTSVPAYYMLLVPPVRPEKRGVLPAVTHVDGSARLQTTNRQLNPRLTELLLSFERITGVPVLLNTSFNDNNEPIVETPSDALACFLRTEIDLLVLGDRLVRKADRP